jgi:hypothetical protein
MDVPLMAESIILLTVSFKIMLLLHKTRGISVPLLLALTKIRAKVICLDGSTKFWSRFNETTRELPTAIVSSNDRLFLRFFCREKILMCPVFSPNRTGHLEWSVARILHRLAAFVKISMCFFVLHWENEENRSNLLDLLRENE